MFLEEPNAAMPGLYGHMIVDPEIACDKSEIPKLVGLERILDTDIINLMGISSYDDFFENADEHNVSYETPDFDEYLSSQEDDEEEQHPFITSFDDEDEDYDLLPNNSANEPEELEEETLNVAA